MNRGDRREPIFRDNADRQRFVETLAEVNYVHLNPARAKPLPADPIGF